MFAKFEGSIKRLFLHIVSTSEKSAIAICLTPPCQKKDLEKLSLHTLCLAGDAIYLKVDGSQSRQSKLWGKWMLVRIVERFEDARKVKSAIVDINAAQLHHESTYPALTKRTPVEKKWRFDITEISSRLTQPAGSPTVNYALAIEVDPTQNRKSAAIYFHYQQLPEPLLLSHYNKTSLQHLFLVWMTHLQT